MKILKYSLFIVISLCVGFMLGQYKGMNDIFLCETTLSANSHLHVLKYIENNSIDKAKNVISDSLEVEMAAIKDITDSDYGFSKRLNFYNHYRKMISLNTDEKIKNLIKRYDSYILILEKTN